MEQSKALGLKPYLEQQSDSQPESAALHAVPLSAEPFETAEEDECLEQEAEAATAMLLDDSQWLPEAEEDGCLGQEDVFGDAAMSGNAQKPVQASESRNAHEPVQATQGETAKGQIQATRPDPAQEHVQGISRAKVSHATSAILHGSPCQLLEAADRPGSLQQNHLASNTSTAQQGTACTARSIAQHGTHQEASAQLPEGETEAQLHPLQHSTPAGVESQPGFSQGWCTLYEEEEADQGGYFKERHVFVVTPNGTCHKLPGLRTTIQPAQSPLLLPPPSLLPPTLPPSLLHPSPVSPPPTTSPPLSPPTPAPLKPPQSILSHSATATASAANQPTDLHPTGNGESAILVSDLEHSNPQHAMPPLPLECQAAGRKPQACLADESDCMAAVHQAHPCRPEALMTPAQDGASSRLQQPQPPELAHAAAADYQTTAAATDCVATQHAQQQQDKNLLLELNATTVPGAAHSSMELRQQGTASSLQQQTRLHADKFSSLDMSAVAASDPAHHSFQAILTEDPRHKHQGQEQLPHNGLYQETQTQSIVVGTGTTFTESAKPMSRELLLLGQTAGPVTVVALSLEGFQAEKPLLTKLDAVRQNNSCQLSSVVQDEVSAVPGAHLDSTAALQNPEAAVHQQEGLEPPIATQLVRFYDTNFCV